VTGPDGTSYGSVEYVPFIGFFRDPHQQNLLLCTDEQTLPLMLIPSGPNTYTVKVAPSVSLEFMSGETGNSTLSENRIRISAPIPNTRLPKGDYVSSVQNKDDDGLSQTFGDVFTSKGTNIELMLSGWVPYDPAYNPLFPAQKTADNNVFSFPPGDTKRYREGGEGGTVATPYGLFRRTVDFQSGSFSSVLVTNIQEYEQEVLRARGFDVGEDINVLFLSGGLSYSENTTVKNVNAQIVEHDRTYAVTHFMKLDYSAFLERRNASLSEKFKQMIDKLVKNPSQEVLDNIIAMFGTHYANAITYGGRGLSQSTLSKDSVVNLVKQGVNIKRGLNFKLGLTDEGMGINDSVGTSSEDGFEELSKITAAKEVQVDTYSCYGSVGCDGGRPASGDKGATQPLYLDLRPLSDLLAPPFYSDFDTVVTARQKLAKAIQAEAKQEIKGPLQGILFALLSCDTTEPEVVSTSEIPLSVSATVAGNKLALIDQQAVQAMSKAKKAFFAIPAGAETIDFVVSSYETPAQHFGHTSGGKIGVPTDPSQLPSGTGYTIVIKHNTTYKAKKPASLSIKISDLQPGTENNDQLDVVLTGETVTTETTTHYENGSYKGEDVQTTKSEPPPETIHMKFKIQILQPHQVFTKDLDVNEIV
jgi:hypothetical protein